jgi:hypothetical protein
MNYNLIPSAISDANPFALSKPRVKSRKSTTLSNWCISGYGNKAP